MPIFGWPFISLTQCFNMNQLRRLFIVFGFLVHSLNAQADRICGGLFYSSSLHTIASDLKVKVEQNFGHQKSNYAFVNIRDYISEKESEEMLNKLIDYIPYGSFELLDPKQLESFRFIVGEATAKKMLDFMEMYRIQISEIYGKEIGTQFSTQLFQIRWTNGVKNLAYAEEWHYDGFWFTIGTTLTGEGSNYTLIDRTDKEAWKKGGADLNRQVAPTGSSLVYTAQNRMWHYEALKQEMPSLYHKGSNLNKPRLFTVQSLHPPRK